jgi:hypothetical protein
MDAAVSAIDTLIACKKRFPNYDLNEDLDQSYDAQKDAIFKDFIKFGVQLVKSYDVRGTETSRQEETDLVENDLEGNDIIKEKVPDPRVAFSCLVAKLSLSFLSFLLFASNFEILSML